MEGFIEVFYAIDRTRREWITVAQLKAYMEENGLEESCLRSWQNMFDPERTGVIRLSKFCEVLDLREDDVRKQFSPGALNDVKIIKTDMHAPLREEIYGLIQEALEKIQDEKELVKYIKRELDIRFNRLWHVVVVYGQYHSYYSYVTGYNFCFKMNDRIFIIYRTPDPFEP
ncbi:putative dynein light chain 1 cytoplasmic [Fasciola gigantica]|uniref:Putative dynein light chain 1 cytoplasmic n=1 Tax=Fasciola gigantica TaxID=46835 RepID=A0A504Z2R1_FASGI|nr:putative dynein light chain 1 cytoplasmic [Fasciola gigantica]